MTRNQKNAPKPTTRMAPSSASRAHGTRIDPGAERGTRPPRRRPDRTRGRTRRRCPGRDRARAARTPVRSPCRRSTTPEPRPCRPQAVRSAPRGSWRAAAAVDDHGDQVGWAIGQQAHVMLGPGASRAGHHPDAGADDVDDEDAQERAHPPRDRVRVAGRGRHRSVHRSFVTKAVLAETDDREN